jgi:hypothetical protein
LVWLHPFLGIAKVEVAQSFKGPSSHEAKISAICARVTSA